MEIANLKEAVKIVVGYIHSKLNDNVTDVKPVNDNRHCMIETIKDIRYYVMFKREPFYAFGKIFRKPGAGESINKSCLELAIKYNIDLILVAYKSGHVYAISPDFWKEYAYNNNTIRTQETGEVTYSIALNELVRWDK